MPLTDQSTVYKRMPLPHISSSSTINRTQSKLNFFSFFFMGGMSWVGLSFHWVDSNHIPFPFPQTFSSSQLGDVVVPPNTEKLCLLKDEKKSVKVFFAIHVCGHGLAASPMGIVSFSSSQQDQSFSVRARARIVLLLAVFHFLSFISSSSRDATFTTTSFLCERGYFSTSAVRGDLLVVNVLLYPLHVQDTSVLSSSYPCPRVVIPCYRMC